MTPEERYIKTKEIVGKFKNGLERYQRSPLFNVVVQQLVRGADPYEVIEQLVNSTEDANEALAQRISLEAGRPYYERASIDLKTS